MKVYISSIFMAVLFPINLFAQAGTRGWQEYTGGGGGGGSGPLEKFIAFCFIIYFWRYSIIALVPCVIAVNIFGKGIGTAFGGLGVGIYLLMKSIDNGWFWFEKK
jgi:hypothetical protein